MASKPKVGSRAWEAELANSPNFAKNTIDTLIARVRQGHADAAEGVLQWLERFPELRPSVRELNDLAVKAEAAWVRAVSLGNPLAERAARDEAAGIKAGLLGPAPSLTDAMLASAVVVAHLAYQRAARVAAEKTDCLEVQVARDRQLAAAQRQLVAAIRGWELIAKKRAKGLRPGGKLKLFNAGAETA